MSALADPVRRALFDHVRGRHRPVTRDEAAEACGVSRSLAAFHLDKLADLGLLHASFQASAEKPRGRGRTPKVYTAGTEIELLIPARRYELMASILAAAVADHPGDALNAAQRLAYARGEQIGRRLTRPHADVLTRAATVLDELGFEPATDDSGRVVLRNCPFHVLATERTELVCGLNHALVEGILDGLHTDASDPEVAARMVPRPDACCVELTREP